MAYRPIRLAYNTAGLQSLLSAAEGATQTFKQGAVLRLSGGNAVHADTADPWVSADVVFGVSAEDAHNLAVANTAEVLSIGTPPGQVSAKITPLGAPIENGKILMYRADGANVFSISLANAQTYSQALMIPGVYYTLKNDAVSGFWYLDITDTTGNNAVAEIVGPVDGDPTACLFIFKATQRYF